MRRFSLLLPAAILAALASLASFAPVAPVVSTCAAAGSNHAALVVEHGDGSAVTRCVAFAAISVSGEELLDRSGLAWSSQTFGGFGDAVCALDGEPAHYADCPGKDSYWAVFVARGGGSWQLANLGISALVLHDGDAEGFRYVPASGTPAAPVSAGGVCAAAAPAPHRTVAPGSSAPAVVATATTGPARAAAAATDPPTAASSPAAGAEATGTGATGTGATATSRPPAAPAPAPSGGADLGLFASALVGGGLAGLAILKLVAGRRPAS